MKKIALEELKESKLTQKEEHPTVVQRAKNLLELLEPIYLSISFEKYYFYVKEGLGSLGVKDLKKVNQVELEITLRKSLHNYCYSNFSDYSSAASFLAENDPSFRISIDLIGGDTCDIRSDILAAEFLKDRLCLNIPQITDKIMTLISQELKHFAWT